MSSDSRIASNFGEGGKESIDLSRTIEFLRKNEFEFVTKKQKSPA
ncbi:hypothetical protein LEP1GSC052_2444 [Leptospira kmetyi serovar Malaysia str. Bejo-Iso9]|nr:hypothetical protein LEP1GSC052_2444 [Leptospira kmetyi serovar Malaysia str. Bejo-Iso9]